MTEPTRARPSAVNTRPTVAISADQVSIPALSSTSGSIRPSWVSVAMRPGTRLAIRSTSPCCSCSLPSSTIPMIEKPIHSAAKTGEQRLIGEPAGEHRPAHLEEVRVHPNRLELLEPTSRRR